MTPARRCAAALAALALAGAVRAAPDEAAQATQAAQVACAGVPLPQALDAEAAREAIDALSLQGDPAALVRACQLWLHTRAHRGDAHVETLRAQATLGGTLVWRQRSAEALPLLRDARERLAAVPGTRRADLGTLSSTLGLVQMQRGDLDAAMAETARAYEEFEGDPTGVAADNRRRVAINFGAMLSRTRQYARATEVLTRVLREYEALTPPEPEPHAAVLRALSVNERRQDRFDPALAYTQQEIALRRAHPATQRSELAAAEQNLGLLYLAAGDFDAAGQALQQALATSEAGGVDLMNHAANVRDTLSSLLLARGRIEAARALAEDALRRVAASQEAGTARAIRPLYRLGEAELMAGDVGAAHRHFGAALALMRSAESAGDIESRYGTWMGWARTNHLLGNQAEADAALQQLRGYLARRSPSPTEAGRLALLGAAVKHAQGDTAVALAGLDEADAHLARVYPPTHTLRVDVALRRCELQGAACAPLAATLAQEPPLPPEVEALAWMQLAAHARAGGDADAALAHGQRALAAAASAADPYTTAHVYAGYAEILGDRQERAQAIFFGKLAVNALQRTRQSMGSLDAGVEQRFVQSRLDLYRRLARRLAEAGRLPEAVAVLRLVKLTEQDDFLERADPATRHDLELTALEAALQAALQAGAAEPATALARLRRLDEAGRITSTERAELDRLLAQRRQQRHEALQRMAAAVARVAALAQAAGVPSGPAPAHPVAAALRPRRDDTVHAYLFLSDRQLSAIVVGRRATWATQAALDPQALLRDIAAWLDDIAARRPAQALSRSLYERIGRLVDAPARRAGARRVVLWLDGPLRYLPLGALHDGRGYLAERYAFVRAAAPGGASAASPQGGGAPLHVRAFGVTRPLAGLPALPGVGAELCRIVHGPILGLAPDQEGCGADPTHGAGPLPGLALANEHFTMQALQRGAAAADGVVHIGTHFVLRPGTASKSWLLLGDGERLTLPQLRALPFAGHALVTLSACESAVSLSDGGDGRELDGLTGTLLRSGARRVLASLWRVDDRATAALMQRFYAELARRPGDEVGALQRAQQAHRLAQAGAAADSPYYWAAFELTDAAP